ncbi:MAG TPA: hypothetical protein VLL52_23365 [Anaerolineae bacterium]|nr:hypothetical protein [Anaerolineae bacterium]
MLSQAKFLSTLPEILIPLLPKPLQTVQTNQPWRWLIQFHYGEKRLHYEVSSANKRDGWEIGFHCESKDKELNRYLLRGFRRHLFEIKDTLGPTVEAEMWDRGWTKIYDVFPDKTTSEANQQLIAQRLAAMITHLQPLYAQLRGDVRRLHR